MTSTEQNKAPLSDEQLEALHDILSHYEVYQEIRDFRSPDSLQHYGPPFNHAAGKPSQFPSLQTIVSKFMLTIPGIRDVSEDFWRQMAAAIITNLEKAELSESYDKGIIGIRRTLATAAAALIEYPARAVFAGFDEPGRKFSGDKYNHSDPDDLMRAFHELMYGLVYGTALDELNETAAKTDKISEHSPLVQAAHEYMLINVASFFHYTLILSPKGQALIALIERTNKLIPYAMVKSTLKIGNAATMTNAMMKVVLAKMSMTSVTNWIGLTKNEDEGQNLLQYIISQVLAWEIRDLKAKATKIEKDKEPPTKAQMEALKGYLIKSREEHESIRAKSRHENKSIVHLILTSSSASADLTPHQHLLAQDYLTLLLSIRDREEILRVFCKSVPDYLTQGVRDLVRAYEPVIRHTHNAVDLSASFGDFQRFLDDLIRLAKIPTELPSSRGGKAKPPPAPSVGDFVLLLKKHVGASHRFFHQVCKNGVEVSKWFHDYMQAAAIQFRRPPPEAPATASKDNDSGAGALTDPLTKLFTNLPEEKQKELLPVLTARAEYLKNLHAASAARLRDVINSSARPNISRLSSTTSTAAPSRSESPTPAGKLNTTASANATLAALSSSSPAAEPGPGAYLARWQDLLDAAAITPAVATGGKVRSGGRDNSVLGASAIDVDVEGDLKESFERREMKAESIAEPFEAARRKVEGLDLEKGPPDVDVVVRALGRGYRRMLAERGCVW